MDVNIDIKTIIQWLSLSDVARYEILNLERAASLI